MNLLWLRTDLRTYDQPALSAALSDGPTLAVYFVCADQWALHGISPAKKSLIIRQVLDLQVQLSKLNVPLLVVDAGDYSGISQHLISLCKSFAVKSVYANDEYEINERQCMAQATNTLKTDGIDIKLYHDQCNIAPGLVTTKQGEMYKVFSAFKRAYMASFHDLVRPMCSKPKAQTPLALSKQASTALDEYLAEGKQLLDSLTYEHDHAQLWPAGESFVLDRLEAFTDNAIYDYADKRDFPSVNATSSLSPYLAIGALTTRQCMHAALLASGQELGDGKDGASVWINEIIWRDFYRHFLFANQDLCKHKPFKTETDRLPWGHDKEMFQAWVNSETGYPIVDAAMAQLKQTGWMHNRLRMVVAMFFTKHLFLDWRLGEAYFMSQLVDGDFASNNGGWQWSASTGVDAAPYFRIFNPVRQSQRFDASGDFIRQYLPKLASLSDKDIHMPSAQQAHALNYPLPIVDHAQAVSDTKDYFKQLANTSGQAIKLNRTHKQAAVQVQLSI